MALIQTLPEVINNEKLFPLGALKFVAKTISNPNNDTQYIYTNTNVYKIVGGDGAYFTDSSLSENFGKEARFTDSGMHRLYIANGDYTLYVLPKYGITTIDIGALSSNARKGLGLDLSFLNFVPNLQELTIPYSFSFGDIKVLADCHELIRVAMADVKGEIFGDISAFASSSETLNVLSVADNNGIYGSIGSCSGMEVLTTLNASRTGISGDISEISAVTSLTSLNVTYCGVSGNIASIGALVNLTNVQWYGSNVTGDYTQLADAMVAAGRTSGTCSMRDATGMHSVSFTINGWVSG